MTRIESKPRPLISLIVLAYKQERFIREAVAGAFAQTYSPLEIILSDDGSPDRTFEIMKEMAAAYAGPHTVVLNRNSRNLGIGGHLNRGMELAKGYWIVVAAGDDISLPCRVERIHQTFSADDTSMAVFSDLEEIDEEGRQLRMVNTAPSATCDNPVECCRHMLRGITGASNSWSRKLFDAFGPMRPDVMFEDRVIAFRAALMGRIWHIREPLVRYRRHATNTVAMFHSEELSQAIRTTDCFLRSYWSAAQDLETHLRKITPDDARARACRGIIRRRIRKLNAYLKIYRGGIRSIVTGWVELLAAGGSPPGAFRATRMALHRS